MPSRQSSGSFAREKGGWPRQQAAPVTPILPDGQISKTCLALSRKIFRFSEMKICGINRPSHPAKGRLAILTDRAVGCDGRCGVRRVHARRAKRSQRTAKSCGSSAATLASSRRISSAGDGGKRGRSPGRARISRKAIARGRPGCLGCTCQTRVHSFTTSAHGNAGAVGARLSLRPFLEERV
jgi:hypothetical protein